MEFDSIFDGCSPVEISSYCLKEFEKPWIDLFPPCINNQSKGSQSSSLSENVLDQFINFHEEALTTTSSHSLQVSAQDGFLQPDPVYVAPTVLLSNVSSEGKQTVSQIKSSFTKKSQTYETMNSEKIRDLHGTSQFPEQNPHEPNIEATDIVQQPVSYESPLMIQLQGSQGKLTS